MTEEDSAPTTRYQRFLAWVRKKDASFFFFMGARLTAAGAGFFTVKFLIDYLVKAEYGHWKAIGAVSTMLIPVMTLTLHAAMMRMYFDYKKDDAEGQTRLVTTTLYLMSGAAALLALGSIGLLPTGLIEPELAMLLTLGTTGAMLFRYFMTLTRIRNDYGLYFVNQVGDRLGFMVLLAFGAQILPDATLAEMGGSRLHATIAFFAAAKWAIIAINLGYYLWKKAIQPRLGTLTRQQISELIVFSAPLSVTFFLGWTLSSSDMYLLKELSTLEDVGDYGFAVGIASFVTLVTQSVLTDWPRFYYAKMRDNPEDRDELIARRVRMFLWIHVAGILVIRLIAGIAYDLYGADDYRTGLEYLNYLVLANHFFLLGNLFSAGIGYVKKNHLTMFTFAVPGILNVLLNLWLIPLWGARAAALTTLCAYAIFAVVSFFVGQRYYRFTNLRWYAITTVAALIVGLVPLSYG